MMITEKEILEAYWAIEGKLYELADEGLVIELEFTDITSDGEPVIDVQIGRRVWREKGGYEIEAVDTAIGLESLAEALQEIARIVEDAV